MEFMPSGIRASINPSNYYDFIFKILLLADSRFITIHIYKRVSLEV